METRLRVRFADNAGFVCAVPAGAVLGDALKVVGTRLGFRSEETAALCCKDPRTLCAFSDAFPCSGLPDDDPDAPNLLRTVLVDIFALRPGLLAALWTAPGASERFRLSAQPPVTTAAFSRLAALHVVSRALSGSLFRGPDEARGNEELVGLLAFYACGQLLQTSGGVADFERFVRLAGLGQCAADPDVLRKRYVEADAASLRDEIIVRASALEYFCAHPLGPRWIFRAELVRG